MHKKPIILVILDGYGYSLEAKGNAVLAANTPTITNFFKEYPTTLIEASGEAVGLPTGQMGNSEVGHMNIGAGRIVYQSLTYINQKIKDKTFFANKSYLKAIAHAKQNNAKLHLFGLVSDGGVHSHLEHIKAILLMAKNEGLNNAYMHAFMDGRDVAPQNGPKYIKELTDYMAEIKFGELASISGRYYAMDRDKNLSRNDLAFQTIANRAGLSFSDFNAYFKNQYQTLPKSGMEPSDEFVIPAYNENVNAKLESNDAVIFMNFRPDRAIQLSTMITNPRFYSNPPLVDGVPAYEAYTPNKTFSNLCYVCTMKYADSVKGEIAFALPPLDNGLGVFLANKGYKQLRIAETEKYAHVTFFFDGTVNYDGVEKPELKGARRVLINSPKVATYDLKPEMGAYEITDALINELNKGDLDVVILNFANPDMVGHTAIMPAVIKALEAVDRCVLKIKNWVDTNGGTLILTADHGNAEKLLEEDGRPCTAHTTNLVQFSINNKKIKLRKDGGKLGNIAPTIIDLLGETAPQEMTESSLITKKG
ncbi:MAG TPA: 2,3-bisphosphoglycerate-independent phosphoglycerate mutase [Bacilli bacterium]|nr:2,3-bisphosphoglycerate-independent phosphoglycerate mutase [Bacilli bacterium]